MNFIDFVQDDAATLGILEREALTVAMSPQEALLLQNNISRMRGFSQQLQDKILEITNLQIEFRKVAASLIPSQAALTSQSDIVPAEEIRVGADSEDDWSDDERACNAHPDLEEARFENVPLPIEELFEEWGSAIERDVNF